MAHHFGVRPGIISRIERGLQRHDQLAEQYRDWLTAAEEAACQDESMNTVTVSVQSSPSDITSWTALARRLESAGFEALLVGDHPGSGPSPWPALGAAAAVTDSLKLGTCVLQCGAREPVDIASDAATLDLLAPGRVILGMGAGHTPAEWTARGDDRPTSADRVSRLREIADAVARLLDGETVSAIGRYTTLNEAKLDGLPAAGTVTLSIGGGNAELLRFAAGHADIVGLSGLGRTKPDGHRHEIRWLPAQIQHQLDAVAEVSTATGRKPAIEALVQTVEETTDRRSAAETVAAKIGGNIPTDALLAAPFALFGTPRQMAEQLTQQQETLGIQRYVVRENTLPVMERVLEHLAR